MNTGISIYFSNSYEKNEKIIRKAISNGAKYAFTSLHIPEETGIDYHTEVQKLLAICKAGDLRLIVDVGPETLEKLGVERIEELEDLGIQYVRLDYGFTPEETVAISHRFHVVFNASTITDENLKEWKKAGADFSRFAACHNFYPKQFTALSLDRVRDINQKLKYQGFTTMAFVPGSEELRGPLYEGLPTVEEHRWHKEEVLLNMLQLFQCAYCDVVLVGDVDITQKDWHDISCISKDYVELHAAIDLKYDFVRGVIHHDRPDSSAYVIRSQESRNFQQQIGMDHVTGTRERSKGSITISNEKYLRYMGELEIARQDLPSEERLNVIGYVDKKDWKYLPYIENGLGVKLI